MQEKIYKQVEVLAKGIQEDLRKKGFVIPTDNRDGTISVATYTIVKERSGFYSIRDWADDVVVDKINLPQTAALLANELALGKFVNNEILQQDRAYGYSLFEENNAKRSIERNLKLKDYEKIDLMNAKMSRASAKKLLAHSSIVNSFEKLRRLR